ncbi:MAG: hypothetical protein KKH32_09135, partial [Bacteroidetes bacterium]|nr:hypothetical protein [Bacteroidota bacterium]
MRFVVAGPTALSSVEQVVRWFDKYFVETVPTHHKLSRQPIIECCRDNPPTLRFVGQVLHLSRLIGSGQVSGSHYTSFRGTGSSIDT